MDNIQKYNLPVFGEIDLNNLDDNYEREIVINGNKIVANLNFDEKNVKAENFTTIEKVLNEMNKFENIAKVEIENDFKNGTEVKDYIEHHLEEIDFEHLNLEIDQSNFVNSVENEMFKKIHLSSVTFYPEYDDEHIVFDYTIGKDLTDLLIVVKFNDNGELEELVMES